MIARDVLERVGDRARLLEDLLLHEVPVRSELDRVAAALHFDDGALDALAGRIEDRVRLASHVGDIAFFEVRDAPRDGHQRRRIGREEMIVLADAHERAGCPAARRSTRPGSRVEITAIAYAPSNSAIALLHRDEQIATAFGVPVRMDQVRDDFGVGLRAERVAARLQRCRAAPRSSR